MSFIETDKGKRLLTKYLKTFEGSSSLKVYRAEIRQFFRFFSCDLNELSDKDFTAYRDHLISNGLTESTLKRKFSILNSFFRFTEQNLPGFTSPIGKDQGGLQHLNYSSYVESQGFKELLGNFLSTLRSKETVKQYRTQVICFFKEIDKKPDDLQYIDFENYKAGLLRKNRKSATILNKFLCLNSFLKFCYPDSMRNPLKIKELRLPPMPKAQGIRNTLNEKEVGQLLSQVDRDTLIGKRDYIMLYLMVYYGLRISEVCNLLWRDVLEREQTMQGESLRIIIRIRKGSLKDTNLFLSNELLVAWDNWINNNRVRYEPEQPIFLPFCHHPKSGKIVLNYELMKKKNPLDTETVSKRMGTYFDKSGIDKGRRVISPHALRHTAVTNMRKAGVPLTTIAHIMGHSDIETTRLYDNPEIDHESHFEIFKNIKTL